METFSLPSCSDPYLPVFALGFEDLYLYLPHNIQPILTHEIPPGATVTFFSQFRKHTRRH